MNEKGDCLVREEREEGGEGRGKRGRTENEKGDSLFRLGREGGGEGRGQKGRTNKEEKKRGMCRSLF